MTTQPAPPLPAPGNAPPRPRREDVTATYDISVTSYDRFWSPVIRPAAAAVIAALELDGAKTVLDIGGGTGALTSALGAAAPEAAIVTLDASLGMLRVGADGRCGRIQADAVALPIAPQCADAVLLAYVLFHTSDPARALTETTRVLRIGGRVGVVTWASEQASVADRVWFDTLDEAELPVLPIRNVGDGLDSPGAIASRLDEAGVRTERAWLHRLECRWEPETFWEFMTSTGTARTRLSAISAASRRAVLRRAHRRLRQLCADDFAWSGEVVCATARRER